MVRSRKVSESPKQLLEAEVVKETVFGETTETIEVYDLAQPTLSVAVKVTLKLPA